MLSERDFRKIVDMIANPPEPNEKLKRAAGRYKKMVRQSNSK